MSHSWQVIESGLLSPDAIMGKDADLLKQLDPSGPSLLHFYEWNVPSLTYGYFTNPDLHLNLEALQLHGLQAARRPTGGGIIFHLTDFAFSVFIPASHPSFSINTLDNYAFINRRVAEAVSHFSEESLHPQLLAEESPCRIKECHAFCMAKPTQYDLTLQGKKVGGAAQRRTKQGFLHQGSLSLLFPPAEIVSEVLKNDKMILGEMRAQSYCLLPEKATLLDLEEARQKLKEILKKIFSEEHENSQKK